MYKDGMSPYNEKAFGLAVQNCVRCSQKNPPVVRRAGNIFLL
ncbi:hypothetical protein CHK_3167 [Christensenella hongkongensis]|uniref:Uncharacterized protein n=1 Tax=Christensenella hongkongensis TaxID=270498 RepID=A0A0M2NAS4_9FIRM|nr:hypothetical protein CHK_3167 [Christensenella hongkongensis]